MLGTNILRKKNKNCVAINFCFMIKQKRKATELNNDSIKNT